MKCFNNRGDPLTIERAFDLSTSLIDILLPLGVDEDREDDFLDRILPVLSTSQGGEEGVENSDGDRFPVGQAVSIDRRR